MIIELFIEILTKKIFINLGQLQDDQKKVVNQDNTNSTASH